MPRFQLITNCKDTNDRIILDYVDKQISDNFIIITDNNSLRNRLNKKGNYAETILDNIPNISDEDHRISKLVWEHAEELREYFSEIKSNEVEVFLGFRHKLYDELIMLEKFHSIFSAKNNIHIILCLSRSEPLYFLTMKIASSLGFEVSYPLTVNGNRLVNMDQTLITEQQLIINSYFTNRIHMESLRNKRKSWYQKFRKKNFFKIIYFIFNEFWSLRSSILQDITSRGVVKIKIISKINAIRYNPVRFIESDKDKLETKLLRKLAISKFEKVPCLLILQTNDIDLYLKPVYPIIEEFKKQEQPYFIIAHDVKTRIELSKRNIDSIDYLPYLYDFGYDFEVITLMIKLIKKLSEQDDSVKNIYFQYLLKDEFILELMDIMRLIRFFSFLISNLNPVSVFVMPDTIGDQLLMSEIAKKYRKKSITTLANPITPSARSIGYYGAETIATYGEDCNTSLIKMGFGNKKLVLTGNPRYDNLKSSEPFVIQSKLSKKYSIDFNKPIILIATTGYDKDEVNWIIEVIRYANEKNYETIIKFHPSYEHEHGKLLLEKSKGLKFYFLKYDDIEINDLILVSTIIITDNSSTGMVGVLVDKPMIVANFLGKPYDYNRYDEYGVALLATSMKELETCIDKVITDNQTRESLAEARKKYQYWYNYKNDGMAAKRIYEILTSN